MANKFVRRPDGVTGSIPHDLSIAVLVATATDAVDKNAWICAGPTGSVYELVAVSEVHSTASSSGTLQLEKCTGTTAPGSGTDLLSSTISLAGAANTVLSGTLSATRSDRIFVAGDRLALDFGGTVTGLVNAIVIIYLKRLQSSNSDR